MNIQLVAALLIAVRELECVERMVRRQSDWRNARKIADIKDALAKVMTQEQEGLLRDFQKRLSADQANADKVSAD